MDSGNRAVQRPPLRGSSKRARQGASDPRVGQSGKLPTHWRRAGGRVRERRRWQSRFTDLPIFTGPSPSWGKSRWVAAPRECRGQPGIGLDCGRGANSWPCLSPQLLPLLTKIKANRDKSRFNEHGRRRQGGGPARGSRGRGGGGRRGVCSVETTAAPAGPAAVIECANDNWLRRWVAAIQWKDPTDRSNG